ncbi:MAG: 3-hydroxyacyl-ACP dehydratase FabZ [Deltaproteobacteria bacterium]|nr:3-hydroxyacyl-ACP dehydratase FabZ [Deltaproteobacteria bacterium]MBW2180451.1 3-hydroxyacyl-ACP dehydratase FabZ [Deltaproteobacteria bacterium]MBW2363721.1 3-hydroxyacyl-ACP dehydratase FabZ [Deltaproteobacteria bacterium]
MNENWDINMIMEVLPHRYPFLLIDRIIDLKKSESLTALKNVTVNEPFFQGHFPSFPVMPGVLIIEAMAQAGGILSYASGFQKKKDLIFFSAMDKVKFRKPVVPGDQIIFKLNILKMRKKVIKMEGYAKVDENVVAEAELMASFGESK